MNLSRTPWDWSIEYNRETPRSKAVGFPVPSCRGSVPIRWWTPAVPTSGRLRLLDWEMRCGSAKPRVMVMSQTLQSAKVLVAALSPETWYNIGLAVVLVAVVVAAILGYRVWEEAHEDVEPATPEELLASFEEARLRGELDEEEFAKVRERIEQSAPRPSVRPGDPG